MYPSGTGQSEKNSQDKVYYQYSYQGCYWQPPNIPPHPPNFTGYPLPPPPEQAYYSQPSYHYPPPNPSVPPPPPPGGPVLEPVSSVDLLVREKLTQTIPLFAPHDTMCISTSNKNEKLSKFLPSDKDTKSMSSTKDEKLSKFLSSDEDKKSPSSTPISEFQLKVDRFTSQHKELFEHLYKSSKNDGKQLHCEASHYEYAIPEPLEYHMGVSIELRRQRILELVSPGDVMRGHVVSKRSYGVIVRLTSSQDSHILRELSDINIKGVISCEKMADDTEKRLDIFEELHEQDVVQCAVVSVNKESGNLELSFRQKHLREDLPSPPQLGYLEGRRPVLSCQEPRLNEYLDSMKQDPGFSNPHCVDNLKAVLGLQPGACSSLLRPILMAKNSEGDYFDVLRKKQRAKWSMESVASGVKLFKSGELSEAMKYFNHALEIDGQNVEGLVARGALYANKSKLREAIVDFEAALCINHSHRNAKKYLVETQIALGQRLEKEGQIKSALRCYQEALADDPESDTAKTKVELLKAVLQRQAAEQEEKLRRKEEEKATLRKLQRIIKKEKRKEQMGPKLEKKRKKSKKKSSKRHRKHEHSHYSSESTDTASSYSRSPSPSHHHHRRRHFTHKR